MKFRIRFAQQIVGLFVIVAGLSLIGVVVTMGASQRWFARTHPFYSVFPSAEGLSVGMPITYRGFSVGRITGIGLTEEDRVHVDFIIQDIYRDRVTRNSILQLVTSPIGLGGGLVFHPGNGDEPLPDGALVPALASDDGQAIVKAGLSTVEATGDPITRIIAQVEPVLRNVNTLLVSVDETVNHVNAALAGDLSGPLGQTVGGVNALIADVTETLVLARDEVGALLVELNGVIAATGPILTNVEAVTDNVAATTEELRDPTGLVPRLLDADGSITTFLNDDNVLYNEVEALLQTTADEVELMLRSINATLDEVNAFTGFVSGTQPQISSILEESRTAISTGQDVLEGLSNNPLIRGGITEELAQPTTFQSYRDAQF